MELATEAREVIWFTMNSCTVYVGIASFHSMHTVRNYRPERPGRPIWTAHHKTRLSLFL